MDTMLVGKIEDHDLNVVSGITAKQIDELIEYTNSDSDIARFTSDLKRFPNKASFEAWRKDKALYSLTDDKENLLGFIWFEWKQLPMDGKYQDFGITIAVRTYSDARGKGYFKTFLEKALEHFKNSSEYKETKNNIFWVSIAKDNFASQKAFENFGFKKIPNKQDQTRIFMIWEK